MGALLSSLDRQILAAFQVISDLETNIQPGVGCLVRLASPSHVSEPASGDAPRRRTVGGEGGMVRVGRVRMGIGATVVLLLITGACTLVRLPRQEQPHERSQTEFAAVFPLGVESLDGGGNDLQHPEWGRADRPYARVAPPSYADGIGTMQAGPPPRYISNRVFNDSSQNVFSENGVTPWAATWGQFLDHNVGLAQAGDTSTPIAFDPGDPLEEFANDLGVIDFRRTPAAPGSGSTTPRQQINTVSSYLDGWAIYGGTEQRLEWLREGPVDGDLSNNGAHMLESTDGYLPTSSERQAPAPEMQLMGRLQTVPNRAVIAGDVRANENIALTAVHTLFVREHNRIVDALPIDLPEELKFQIARRIVTAEIQYITYTEFLPALGIHLPPYPGYDPDVDATLSNEFATVGYRAHSMLHGTIDALATPDELSPLRLDSIRSEGIEVNEEGQDVELEIPLNVVFGNPDLLETVGLEPVLRGLASERQYRNDEMIDNQLRSVLFQVPGPDVADPSGCLDGQELPGCFRGVLDLGAIDIQRGRDHGIPAYNDLRAAYGLSPKPSFTAITGEFSQEYPGGAADWIDDPGILDFTQLLDADGQAVEPGSEAEDEEVVTAVRRATLAARLAAIYGTVDRLDGFVGMLSEQHFPGTEFGELQLAIWTRQFEALRDGDRFFYLNDPSLQIIEERYGVDYRHTLAQVIEMNSNVTGLQDDVFRIASGSA